LKRRDYPSTCGIITTFQPQHTICHRDGQQQARRTPASVGKAGKGMPGSVSSSGIGGGGGGGGGGAINGGGSSAIRPTTPRRHNGDHRTGIKGVGHAGPVVCVRYSRDAQHLASSSMDRTACTFRLPIGRHQGAGVCSYLGHDGIVNSVDWSHDVTRPLVVTAGEDGTARIWARGRSDAVLSFHRLERSVRKGVVGGNVQGPGTNAGGGGGGSPGVPPSSSSSSSVSSSSSSSSSSAPSSASSSSSASPSPGRASGRAAGGGGCCLVLCGKRGSSSWTSLCLLRLARC
jgi:hypothetical protein